MLTFPDPNVETEYTDPNGSVWEFNGTGWVRQCDSSGGGSDGGDLGESYWPSMTKPSIDLMALQSGVSNFDGKRAVDFLRVEPDGSLTNYYRHENTQAMNTVAFAHTRPLVAIGGVSSSVLEIYDYSTSPFQLVHSVSTPANINNQRAFAFSASDEYIFGYDSREAWALKESSAGSNDWSLFSPKTTIISDDIIDAYAKEMGISESEKAVITTYNMTGIRSIPHWTGDGEPYFCAAVDVAATGEIAAPYSVVTLKATATGVELVHGCRVSSFLTGTGQSTSVIKNISEGHPHLPAVLHSFTDVNTDVLGSNELSRWSAGLLYFANYQCGSIAKLAPPRHKSGWGMACGFSPSGNYAFVTQKDSYLNFYRVHKDGSMEYLSQINYQAESSEGASAGPYGGNWSADEKFFYVFTRQAVSADGDQGIVLAYDFDESGATLIGKAAEIRGNDTAYCLPARSKF